MSKHSNILHSLYYGEISPWENRSDLSADLHLKQQDIDKIFKRISDKLNDDDKAALAKLNDKYDMIFRLIEEDKFCDGFKLGVKFAVEVFGGG